VASDTLRRPLRRAAGDCAITPAVSVPAVGVPAPAATSGRAGVVIEVVHLRADMSGRWHYRRTAEDLPAWTEPDRAARSLAGLDDISAPNAVLHSTSWRYDPAGHVVLTYAVLPDLDPEAAAKPLPSMEIARGQHHAHPAPVAAGPDHVAAHAIRHLAWLASTDPIVTAALGGDGSVLREALAAVCPDPAGQLV